MIKRWAYVLVLMFFFSSTIMVAQKKNNFWKTVGEVAKALTEESNSNSDSGGNSSGSQSSENKSDQSDTKESSNSSGGEKITTPHSDIKLDIKSCKVQGNNLELDLLITNIGSGDINFKIWDNTAFDDEGNQYSNIPIYLGNEKSNGYTTVTNILPKDIKVKMKLIIANIDPNATKLAKIILEVSANGNYTINRSHLTIENVTILR